MTPQFKFKTVVKGNYKDVSPEVQYYMDLVYMVRESNDKNKINEAFQKIVDGLEIKIKKIAGKYKIPGLNFDDVYQECLVALNSKAIKDYDETRGKEPGKPAPFDRFALMCIRRHLATTLKTSQQNKHRVQNESKSLDQDRSQGDDDLSLVNIVCAPNSDVIISLQKKENFKVLMSKLLSKLSGFEKQVFKLYAQQYTYEEIAYIINSRAKRSEQVNIKGVDNALSRIKNKSKIIMENVIAAEKKAEDKHQVKKVDNALQRVKTKAKKIVLDRKKPKKF